jgi:hypothetical protein
VGDVCRHRAVVSKVATFPEPVSVVNIQEIHADVPVFTYLHLEAGSELLHQLDHQMCIDMLSQLNVSTEKEASLGLLHLWTQLTECTAAQKNQKETAPVTTRNVISLQILPVVIPSL